MKLSISRQPSQRDSLARRRFQELSVKEALGQTTPAETIKLCRYQALLRYKPSAGERANEFRMHYDVERAIKLYKRILRESAQSPNGEVCRVGEAGKLKQRSLEL